MWSTSFVFSFIRGVVGMHYGIHVVYECCSDIDKLLTCQSAVTYLLSVSTIALLLKH